jgi:Tfp pilus assembly ATPase PilU
VNEIMTATRATSSRSKIRSMKHQHRKCLIEQVEIGIDAPDFRRRCGCAASGPDVIVSECGS